MSWDSTINDDRVVAIQARSYSARTETDVWTAAAVLAKWTDALDEVMGALAPIAGAGTVAGWDAESTCPAMVLRLTALGAARMIELEAATEDTVQARMEARLEGWRARVTGEIATGRVRLLDDSDAEINAGTAGASIDDDERDELDDEVLGEYSDGYKHVYPWFERP